MTDRWTERELDALAYADGLLDDDPARKAQVEEAMRGSPELSARIRAYGAQNEALREAFNVRLHEPVPGRLLEALDRNVPSRVRHFARAAGIAALIASAGIAGWLFGQSEHAAPPPANGFVEQSFQQFASTASDLELVEAGQPQIPSQAGDKVALNWQAPDLAQFGYELARIETRIDDGRKIAALTYAGMDGDRLGLFLWPRGSERERNVQMTTRDNISLAHWVKGPLASALAGHLAPEALMPIAKSVSAALARPGFAPPPRHPSTPVQGDDLITELPAPESQMPAVSPPLPSQHRPTPIPN